MVKLDIQLLNDEAVSMVVLIFLAILISQTISEKSPKLKVIPSRHVSEVGNDAIFQCNFYPMNIGNAKSLSWLLPDGISVKNSTYNQSNMSHIVNEKFHVENGQLIIRNISQEDSGVYTCIDKKGSLSEVARLKVFLMPTYFQEGMVVIVLNGSLIVILLTCFVWTTYLTRKEYKKIPRKDMEISV